MNDINSKSLEVRVKLEFTDFLRFNYTLFYGRSAGAILTVLGVCAVIILSFGIIPAFKEKAMPIVSSFLPIASLILFILFLLPVIIFFQAKKVMSNDRFLKSEQRYTFHDGGIRVSSGLGNASIRWSDVYRAVSYKHVIAIFLAKNRAYIIPASAFRDDASRLEVIKKIKENIDPKKLKIKK